MEAKEFWKVVFSTPRHRARWRYLELNPEVGRQRYYRNKYGVQAAGMSEIQITQKQWSNSCRS